MFLDCQSFLVGIHQILMKLLGLLCQLFHSGVQFSLSRFELPGASLCSLRKIFSLVVKVLCKFTADADCFVTGLTVEHQGFHVLHMLGAKNMARALRASSSSSSVM
jgi:hypothetical protein